MRTRIRSRAPAFYRSRPHWDAKTHRFQNPWPSFDQRTPLFTYKTFKDFRSAAHDVEKNASAGARAQDLPVHKPSFQSSSQVQVTWLGHACFLVDFPRPRSRSLRILFDPVFSERCSPFSFFGPKRLVRAPVSVGDLPAIDIVCVSHNHYDHMDYRTLRDLVRVQKDVQIVTSLGNATWFSKYVTHNVVELDWWDEVSFPDITCGRDANEEESHLDTSGGSPSVGETPPLRITATPAQHGSRRGIFDEFKTLWAGFAVEFGGHKVYFTGDTGYRTVFDGSIENKDGLLPYHDGLYTTPTCPAFSDIGAEFGSFDMSLIPIGAYSPEAVFSRVHITPADAVRIHRDINSRLSIGMHYGTWVLTTEPFDEPPRLLNEERVPEFKLLNPGQTHNF